jgi:nitroreductase
MSGIAFFKTKMLAELKSFYTDSIGCDVWLEQADCALFRHGNFIFGFCQREEVDPGGMLTFFYKTREEVDLMYAKFKDIAVTEPADNDKYQIYQFFAQDPEGRMLEFQWFNHPVDCHLMGDELLLTRRSFRKYLPTEVPQPTLDKILEICRFAPTSMNTQSYYFRLIREREAIEKLSEVREKSSRPIANAPMAVAICSDPEASRRHIQDGCIAAYHFILAAWSYGLGTCWIAAMDREEVKQILNIPDNHYVATVTPLGFPQDPEKEAPERKDVSWYLRQE